MKTGAVVQCSVFKNSESLTYKYADITPELDGIVGRIDKEVVIKDSAGKRVCADLLKELERRGICGMESLKP